MNRKIGSRTLNAPVVMAYFAPGKRCCAFGLVVVRRILFLGFKQGHERNRGLLNWLLDDVVDYLDELMGSHGRSLETNFAFDYPMTYCDKMVLRYRSRSVMTPAPASN